ncbi:hypothetical protein D3C77_449230 [compost metagenome]
MAEPILVLRLVGRMGVRKRMQDAVKLARPPVETAEADAAEENTGAVEVASYSCRHYNKMQLIGSKIRSRNVAIFSFVI